MRLAAITINLSPEFDVFGLTLTWHGLMVSLGIGLALWLSWGLADRRGLDREKVLELGIAATIGGMLGARLFHLLLNDPDTLLRPGEWLASTGFAIYGGVIGAVLSLFLMVSLRHMSWGYLDVIALSFPIGLAVGRVGDLINGEHYGSPTELPWGVIHSHPDASVPSVDIAYHDGGLYEILLGLAIFSIVWPLRDRIRRPTVIFWLTIGLYGVGRFVMFFYRSDTEPGVLGLNVAQLTSLGFVAAAFVGILYARRTFDDEDFDGSPIAAAAGYAAAKGPTSGAKR